MKAILIAVSFLFALNAHAEDYSLKTITCAYKSQVSGKVLKPIVTWGKYKGKNKQPVLVLALAYIQNGEKQIETAAVTASNYVGGFENYGVKATTQSGKHVEISVDTVNKLSTLKINGVVQNYLPKLRCNVVTNAK